jgi:hypothetical protein
MDDPYKELIDSGNKKLQMLHRHESEIDYISPDIPSYSIFSEQLKKEIDACKNIARYYGANV